MERRRLLSQEAQTPAGGADSLQDRLGVQRRREAAMSGPGAARMTIRTILTAGLLVAASGLPLSGVGEQQAATRTGRPKPQVEFVQTVGCVERRTREDTTWWLTRAAEPTVTRQGVFNEVQVEEARQTAPGTGEFRLIGVADFLTAEGLLNFGDRALFTEPDQINASGELRPGRTVLVKGLLIETDDESRINLMSVVGLADTCP